MFNRPGCVLKLRHRMSQLVGTVPSIEVLLHVQDAYGLPAETLGSRLKSGRLAKPTRE